MFKKRLKSVLFILLATQISVSAENLLKNPSFEEEDEKGKPSEWRVWTNEKVSFDLDTAEVQDGEYSLRAVKHSDGSMLIDQRIPLPSGIKRIKYSAKIKVSTDFAGYGILVKVTFCDADNKSIKSSRTKKWVKYGAPFGQWKTLFEVKPVPQDATSLNFSIVDWSGSAAGTIWCDDTKVIPLKEAPKRPAKITLPGFASQINFGCNPGLTPVKYLKAPVHEPLPIIKNGRVNVIIVYDHQSEEDIRRSRRSVEKAAKLLQEMLKKITGDHVSIKDVKDINFENSNDHYIVVGKNRITDKMNLDVGKLPREGFYIRTFDRGVIIAGRDGSVLGNYKKHDSRVAYFLLGGTLWGVVDFTERFLGVRYYYPGPGVYIPRIKQLSIKPAFYKDAPLFNQRVQYNFFREFGVSSKKWPWPRDKFSPDWNKFLQYWRIGRSVRATITHAPNSRKFAKLYAQEQPELFYRDESGKLWADTESEFGNVWDISNPAFLDHFMQICRNYYQKDELGPFREWYAPNDEYIPFGFPDVGVRTKWSNKLLTPDRGRLGVMSDVMADFYLRLCKRVQKEFPEKKVSGWAYSNYRLPPLQIKKYPANYDHHFCHGNNMLFLGKQCILQSETQIVKQWSQKVGKKISAGWYDNGGLLVLAQINGVEQYFKTMTPDVSGILMWTSGPQWGRGHLYEYIKHKSFWNPNLDIPAMIDEYCYLMYGQAAPYIRYFIYNMKDAWQKYKVKLPPTTKKYLRADLDYVELYRVYNAELLYRMEYCLGKAVELVKPGSIEMTRIEFFRNAWLPEIKNALEQTAAGEEIGEW